ncbi:hypothetical protein GGR57DRAFT_463279 [Xylariaceae sp. FL1272]|nr:hypothetical protein GGR57DRAFT_463279 [Xylariaceae sp. FL1272]
MLQSSKMLTIQPDNMMSIADVRSKQAQPPLDRVISRDTRDGRRLFYRMEVLQQPERARACGSEPKSSNDRRPVDPPPVVVLKIYEGPSLDQSRDVTFDYNVDFFCYASLEQARVIAPGRVQAPQANQVPVLSGFPVSGCCYLDRPDPAGYFIFPDLSVRHEGRYRLVFSLYELVKDEKDLDPISDASQSGDECQLNEARHRMDLNSAEFTVYSAKKFPGLTESTSLSRTVAEQGCRVRIRRDIRMRRREPNPKPSAPEEYNNGEDRYKRGGTQTPDQFRTRSVSNSSMNRAPYPAERRPSIIGDYEGGPPPPSPYTTKPPGSNILNFNGQSHKGFSQPSYAPAPSSNPQSTPVSPAQTNFPYGTGTAVPQSPSYTNPAFSPFHQSDSERYPSYSQTPIAARPLRSDDLRSSISSVVSTDGRQLPVLLPQVGSDVVPRYQQKLPTIAPAPPTRYWPEQSTGPMKRSADSSFPSHDHHRNIEGDRMETQRITIPSPFGDNTYRRADGSFSVGTFPCENLSRA